MPPAVSKICNVCKVLKLVEEFHKNTTKRDGRQGFCKECGRTRKKKWSSENADKQKLTSRNYYINNIERNKEISRIWRSRNKERVKLKVREWQNKNIDKVRDNRRIWVNNNKSKLDRIQKEWRTRNPDKVREFKRKWNERNSARVKTKNKEWRLVNQDRVKEIKFRRRAAELGARGSCSYEQLYNRRSFYGHLCWICGKDEEAVDHVIPLSKGGTNWPANLRPICKSCNSSKKDKHPSVYLTCR